jgi:hypothetical protein
MKLDTISETHRHEFDFVTDFWIRTPLRNLPSRQTLGHQRNGSP